MPSAPLDNDLALAQSCIQKILDYQMPTGEWGYYSGPLKDRYLRVKRDDYTRHEYLALFRKPNGYRTLTAMEVLREYCGAIFNNRIQRAVQWIKASLSSGCFLEWEVFGTGPLPDRPDMPHVEKTPDIRHTAQALISLLKFDRHPGSELAKGIYNVLNQQSPTGMWPRKVGANDVEIFRSVCCADLLFHAVAPEYRRKLVSAGLGVDFFQRARIALDRTGAWLLDCASQHGGLWVDEYQTAMVLERLGKRLTADKRYLKAIETAVAVLLERTTDGGWHNSAIRDPDIRYSELSKYETTIRIAASLCQTSGQRLWISDDALQSVKDFRRLRFRPDEIDASDYRYFIQVFARDSMALRSALSRTDFVDYLDRSTHRPLQWYPGRLALFRTLTLWVIDCLDRLESLAEGRALALPNYDLAFLEKEEELLNILESMRSLNADQPLQVLPASLLCYLQTGDAQDLRQKLQTLATSYQLRIEPRRGPGQRIYHEIRSVFVEVLAKYLEGVTKP